MEKKYIPRLFDQIIEFSLKSKGAVVVVGPKWCGKSTTVARYAKTLIDKLYEDEKITSGEYRECLLLLIRINGREVRLPYTELQNRLNRLDEG